MEETEIPTSLTLSQIVIPFVKLLLISPVDWEHVKVERSNHGAHSIAFVSYRLADWLRALLGESRWLFRVASSGSLRSTR